MRETARPQGVFDFDQTLTLENTHYPDRFRNFFCVLTGLSFAAYDQLWPVAKQTLARGLKENPQAHGWFFAGHNVAPGGADVILFHQNLAAELVKILKEDKSYTASTLSLPDLADRSETEKFLYRIYRGSYSADDLLLKPELVKAFEELSEKVQLNIVTNSAPANVKRVIDKEAPEIAGFVMIFGRAQKFAIDPAWDLVDMELEIPGFPRSILLRRHAYYNILEQIMGQGKIAFVAGDIFELDLALIHALKKQDQRYSDVLLFLTQTVFSREFAEYEEAYFRKGNQSGRFLVGGLREIPQVLKTLK